MKHACRTLDGKNRSVLKSVLFLLVLLFSARYPAYAIGPAILDRNTGEMRLGTHLEIFEDHSGRHTIDTVSSGESDRLFVPSHAVVPAFGFTRSTVWLRFSVDNKNLDAGAYYLEIQNPILDEVDFYIPEKGGFSFKRAGDHTLFSSREIKYRTIVLPVTIPPGARTYYVRVHTSSYMNLPLTLWTPAAFFDHASRELPLLWMFYGLMLIMAVYNCFIYFSSRDISYLYYSLFILSFVLFHLAYNGFAGQYLWEDFVWWTDVSIPVFLAMVAASFIMFSRSFLNTVLYYPVLDRILLGNSILFALIMILTPVIDYQLAVKVLNGLCLIFLPILMIAGILSLRRGSREAIFYILAWTVFIIGTMLHILKNFGVLPETFITTWSQQFGAVLQAMLLSLGLADRINTMRKQIAESHNKLIETNTRLDEERELLFVTLKCIADGVISTNLHGKIFLMNAAAEQITGYAVSQAVSRDIREVFNPVSCTGSMPDVMRLILENKGNVDLSREDLMILDGDIMRNISCNCSPIMNADNKIVGIVIVFCDITQKRKYEEEIIRSSKLDAISTLAGGIAHDFNNVLTAIVGNVSLAKLKTEDPEFVSGILTDTESAAYRAKDLTQQLLTFSKGGAPIKAVSNIKDLLREVVYFHLSGSNVKVETDIEEDLWNASIDEGQMSQVIGNIVINAKQAMPEGGRIWVTAMNIVVASDDGLRVPEGQYLRISIRDEGCGIPPEHLGRIFDPFYTTKPEGNGLGLASSISVIKNHDGNVEVLSSPGQGAEFIIYLPATEEKPQEVSGQEALIARGSGRILFMDDEDFILKSISGLIRAFGYEVDCIHNGFEAVMAYRNAMVAGRPYDLVITDLTIPGSMGGKDTAQKLIEMDPKVKVIATSGYSNDPIMSSYRAYGFQDIIIKPYSLKTLSTVIARVLAAGRILQASAADSTA